MKKINTNKNKLHLGCGFEHLTGYLNVDNNVNTSPDKLVDLNKTPWPFRNNQFDEVLAKHVLEHLENPTEKMQELYRITKNGGVINIRVPHFSYGWANITHVTPFSINTFNFWDSRNLDNKSKKYVEVYGMGKFEVLEVRLTWVKYISKKRIFLRMFNVIINYFANKNKYLCERIWCYWVGGFEEIYFKVKVIK